MSFAERRRTLLSQGGGIKADPVLENNDWETISAVAQSGEAANFWKVGDTKLIWLKNFTNLYPSMPDLTNFPICARIIGFNHNESIEGEGIHFQLGCIDNPSKPDVAFVDANYGKTGSTTGFRMNTTATATGGWKDSFMRNTICSIFFNQCLPDDLKAVIQPCTKYTNNGRKNTPIVTTTQDNLWLLSEFEVTGTTRISASGEATWQKQYDYYKNIYANGKKPAKYKHNNMGTLCGWWLRSSKYDADTFSYIMGVAAMAGDVSHSGAITSYGFAPCFKV